MKISTKISAQEMSMMAPSAEDLAVIKKVIPNASQFPYPTPEAVKSAFNSLDYNERGSSGLDTFLTGRKFRGSGIALASYPVLYKNAITHLENLWQLQDSPQEMFDYLLAHPISYKKGVEPEGAVDSNGQIIPKLFVSRCISNLMDWLYLSSLPAYQYLREQLLEKARYIRTKLAQGIGNVTRVFPHRSTTSRSLGENETNLHRINAGYKIVQLEDPFDLRKVPVLQLVTWFFTNSQTDRKVFVDFFDIVNGDIDGAMRQMRRSKLYREWASKMSPKEYAAKCGAFQLQPEEIEENIEGLTLLTGSL